MVIVEVYNLAIDPKVCFFVQKKRYQTLEDIEAQNCLPSQMCKDDPTFVFMLQIIKIQPLGSNPVDANPQFPKPNRNASEQLTYVRIVRRK